MPSVEDRSALQWLLHGCLLFWIKPVDFEMMIHLRINLEKWGLRGLICGSCGGRLAFSRVFSIFGRLFLLPPPFFFLFMEKERGVLVVMYNSRLLSNFPVIFILLLLLLKLMGSSWLMFFFFFCFF